MKECTLKNCGYEEAQNLLLSRGISKPLFSVEAWKTGRNYSLGVDVGAHSAHSGVEESASASLVAEILLNMASPVSAPTALLGEEADQ